MALSRREQNRAFKKNIIYGCQILNEWEVDHYELAYIILKQNLSILDLPKRFNRYSNPDGNSIFKKNKPAKVSHLNETLFALSTNNTVT